MKKIDMVFINGKIYDGLGNPPVMGAVGIGEDKILYPLEKEDIKNSEKVIDIEGLALSPGFINIHSHSDMAFLVDGRVPSLVYQGVTTEVVGNCGYSLAPLYGEPREEVRDELKGKYDMDVTWKDFKGFFDLIEERGISINMISLAGHGTIRGSVVGPEDRQLKREDLRNMQEELHNAIKQGAWGLSTGLIYPPGCYAETDELIEMADIVQRNKGIYSSHIRGEGDNLFEALKEAIKIGEKTGIPVEVSHLKASGERNWGKTKEALNIIKEAREKGIKITHDQYPYTASATALSVMVPSWAHDGGKEGFIKRLKDENIRRKILKEMEGKAFFNGNSVLISHVKNEKNKKYEGREVNELAKEEERPVFEFILDLLLEEEGQVGAIYMCMDEEDVMRVMKDPFTAIGNDASACAVSGPLFSGKPHPRAYGAFPRVLGHYSREMKLFPLEEGIRKMTSYPAKILGINNRGVIKNNFIADLAIFNPERIMDSATFSEPHQYSEGIEYVLVNGKIAFQKGEILPVRAGRVIRHGV